MRLPPSKTQKMQTLRKMMKQPKRDPKSYNPARPWWVMKQIETSSNLKWKRMKWRNSELEKAHTLLNMNWINLEAFKGSYFLLWEVSLVLPATNLDILQHTVKQSKSIQINKRCRNWKNYLKQTNGEDNPSPGTLIISMGIVFIVKGMTIKPCSAGHIYRGWSMETQGELRKMMDSLVYTIYSKVQ